MIQAEFENGIEDENNFQIQEIDFQNGANEDDRIVSVYTVQLQKYTRQSNGTILYHRMIWYRITVIVSRITI